MEGSIRPEGDGTRCTPSKEPFVKFPVWLQEVGVSGTATQIYIAIGTYANYETLEAYPSRATLAKDIGKSLKSVDRAIKELQDVGALHVTQRTKPGSKENHTNLYRLVFEKPVQAQGVGTPVTPPLGTPVTPPRDTSDAENETHLTRPIDNKNNSSIFGGEKEPTTNRKLGNLEKIDFSDVVKNISEQKSDSDDTEDYGIYDENTEPPF